MYVFLHPIRVREFSLHRILAKQLGSLQQIVGNAGVGKTAFIAKLTENNDEISAVHFCRYDRSSDRP